MKNKLILLCVFGAIFSLSCTTSKHKTRTAYRTPKGQTGSKMLAIDQKRKSQEARRQDQKDRSRLLSRKSQIRDTGKNPVVVQANAVPEINVSEDQLYSELYQRFERNDEIGFQSRMQMLMTKYPDSARADDALYLAGLLAVSNKNYGPALKFFNQVIAQYPYSNKAVSAQFGKAAVFKKMNLNSMAEEAFQKVATRYPGSPEALRAKNELRLLK